MSERKPNVIVFFTDQQRWDTSGLHGNPLELTPNFDRMAQEGTFLKYSYTCQPVCGPARSCLQTGKYATTTGCFRNNIPLPADEKTLAHHFREAGYTTGYIGKWHLCDEEPIPEEKRGGYEYWLASNLLEFTSGPYRCGLYDNDNKEVILPGYRVDAMTDAAIRYIDSNKDNPFFLFLSFIEPHHQNHLDDYPPPDGYRERYTGRWTPPDLQALIGTAPQHLGGYYGMVKRLDEAFGRLRDALKSLDLTDDTILLFTTDHGSHFKTRNGEYKRSCHESSLRLPTAITGPGFISGGCRQELTSLIDIPPTLLEAAGIPVPDDMQGNSIMPLLRNEKVDWPEEIFAQISESMVGRTIRTRRWKYCIAAEGLDPRETPAADEYQEYALYDLESDPYELFNLIDRTSHINVCDKLRQIMIRRMVETGEKAPKIIPLPKNEMRGTLVRPHPAYEWQPKTIN